MTARIGLQLYTVKEQERADLIGTLRAVARIGFDGVEFSSAPAEPARVVADTLAEVGLTASGIVVPMERLNDSAAFGAAIEYSHRIGSSMILFPWLDEPYRADAAAYQATAELLNRFGRTSWDNGLRFLYHIHGYEFVSFGEQTGFDVLMERCDKELVGLELDTYWVARGGQDPLAVYRKHASRCLAIHFKDVDPTCDNRDIEVGMGTVDTAGILRAAQDAPTEWFIVEQENFDRPPMESAAISFKNLTEMVRSSAVHGDRTKS